MHSALTTQTIQQIKNSVDQREACGWLGGLQTNTSKRYQADRYIDGAMKIIDLLRKELSQGEIDMYEDLYET